VGGPEDGPDQRRPELPGTSRPEPPGTSRPEPATRGAEEPGRAEASGGAQKAGAPAAGLRATGAPGAAGAGIRLLQAGVHKRRIIIKEDGGTKII